MIFPRLDFRDKAEIYQQTLTLARAYCPEWSDFWPESLDDAAVAEDPGLVLMKLFSHLMAYTIDQENNVPLQRRLAFFQFMAASPRPPIPASTVITFNLREKKPPVIVAAASRVLTQESTPIIFQTEQDLEVLPASITNAFSVFPSLDKFVSSTAQFSRGDASTMFIQGTGREAMPRVSSVNSALGVQSLGHWFLMGDSTLFKPDASLQSISIKIYGKHLTPLYFDQWFDGNLHSLPSDITGTDDGAQLTVVLTVPPSVGSESLNDYVEKIFRHDGGVNAFELSNSITGEASQQNAYWMSVKPAENVAVLAEFESQLPVITGLQVLLSGKTIQPDHTASNDIVINSANGAYPFGKTPKLEDAFYINSDSVFSKVGARVTLFFDVTTVTEIYPVTLDWQFWDGSSWQSFISGSNSAQTHFVDSSNAMQYNNSDGKTFVQFICPVMKSHTVAGQKGLWIRVVVADGSYGEAGGFSATPVATTINDVPSTVLTAEQKNSLITYLNNTAGVNFSYRFDDQEYAPPYIRSLTLTYSFESIPDQLFCYNAFDLTRFLFQPYKPIELDSSAFYLGISPLGICEYGAGKKLSLYFKLQQNHINQTIDMLNSGRSLGSLVWQYYDGKRWRKLDIDDGTNAFTLSGIVSFYLPEKLVPALLFSREAIWLRVCDLGPGRNIILCGVYPNAVTAVNKIEVENEILGSSNEMPSQQFQLNNTPVTRGAVITVIEPAGLSAESDQSNVLNPQNTVERVWSQVDNFAFSSAADRVYTLDHATGTITFGDGRNGIIPPSGHNNIVAQGYTYTQGLEGNVATGEVNVLKPGISSIAEVTNPAPAIGGVAGDGVAWIQRNGASQIRTCNRAVQLLDMAPLALASSPQVDKATAIQQLPLVDSETLSEAIVVYVLPISRDLIPIPDLALLQQVQQFIRERSLITLVDAISVKAPDFIPINLGVQLDSNVPSNQRNQLKKIVATELRNFLQPVFGGPKQLGWNFGQPIRVADVTHFCRKLTDVSNVIAVTINGEYNTDFALLESQLPIAGVISVFIYGATD